MKNLFCICYCRKKVGSYQLFSPSTLSPQATQSANIRKAQHLNTTRHGQSNSLFLSNAGDTHNQHAFKMATSFSGQYLQLHNTEQQEQQEHLQRGRAPPKEVTLSPEGVVGKRDDCRKLGGGSISWRRWKF